MKKQKIYAVRKGYSTGIFHTWDECEAQIAGFPKAEYKSFTSEEDAEKYLNGEEVENGKKKTRFYAVRNGWHEGVFKSWEECQEQTKGYSGAEYKSFGTKEEAEDWLYPHRIKHHEGDTCYAYVDGSYNPETGVYGCGGFLIDQNGNKHIIQESGCDEDIKGMRNVAGEILGSTIAANLALSLRMPHLTVYYDYYGIEKWAFGEWKATKKGTIAYREAMKKIQATGMTISFTKVKGHTGIHGNEEADRLAKEAVGVV